MLGNKSLRLALLILIILQNAGCAMRKAKTTPAEGAKNAAKAEEKWITTPSGLKYLDVNEGAGAQPQIGQTLMVKYVGTLENGTIFDQDQTGFQFRIGRGQVIKGWDEGVASMKVGGRRKLIIPPNLAYGERGYPGVIPPNSTLHFDVTLVAVK